MQETACFAVLRAGGPDSKTAVRVALRSIDECRKLKDTRRLAPRRSSGRCTWLDPTIYNRRRRRFLLV